MATIMAMNMAMVATSKRRPERVGKAIMPRLSLLRAVCVVVLAGIGGWLSLSLSLSLALTTTYPAIANSWWPTGRARASYAAQILDVEPNAVTADQAATMAKSALRLSPAEVVAYRTLSLAASARNDVARVDALIRHAEKISRRDLPTQVMLIEASVQRGDINTALKHYDRALRVHREAQDLLLPVLATAANDPDIAASLLTFMRARPIYWAPLTSQIIGGMTDPAALAGFLVKLRLQPGQDPDNSLLSMGLRRLSDDGNYRQAEALYLSVTHERELPVIRNGDFGHVTGLAPFDWKLAQTTTMQAQVLPREDGNLALFIAASGSRTEAARQLLLLKPGDYRFAAQIGDSHGDIVSRVRIDVRCTNGSPISATQAPVTTGSSAVFGMDFTVPPGCSGQWIVISAAGDIDNNLPTPWLDNVKVVRR